LFPDLSTRRLLAIDDEKKKLASKMEAAKATHRQDSLNLRRCEIFQERHKLLLRQKDEAAFLESTIEVFLQRKGPEILVSLPQATAGNMAEANPEVISLWPFQLCPISAGCCQAANPSAQDCPGRIAGGQRAKILAGRLPTPKIRSSATGHWPVSSPHYWRSHQRGRPGKTPDQHAAWPT
jgi:hypothetical protein